MPKFGPTEAHSRMPPWIDLQSTKRPTAWDLFGRPHPFAKLDLIQLIDTETMPRSRSHQPTTAQADLDRRIPVQPTTTHRGKHDDNRPTTDADVSELSSSSMRSSGQEQEGRHHGGSDRDEEGTGSSSVVVRAGCVDRLGVWRWIGWSVFRCLGHTRCYD